MSTWNDENRWYARLMKLAHELAMEGRGEEAQDLRVAANTCAELPLAARPQQPGELPVLPVQRPDAGEVQRPVLG